MFKIIIVSMPSAGYSHFYRKELQAAIEQLEVCQCPRRAILISTQKTKLRAIAWMCQCPRRAILISTEINEEKEKREVCVSMPSAGYSHFYRLEK